MIRTVVTAAVTALAAATLACGNSTGPGAFAGRYDLQRYQGLPLPAISNQSEFGTVFVVSERLTLDDDGNGLMVSTGRSVDAAHPNGDNFSYARAFGYIVLNSQIAITFACPPNADCIAGPHLVGERVADGLALTPPASSRPASFYKRN
jgi:hypothetical protein